MDADYFIDNLELQPHPEGGYYSEVYRSQDGIPAGALPAGYKGGRAFATSIYFLLNKGQCSCFHILRSDELWYYHAGGALEVYLLTEKGELMVKELGLGLKEEQSPQVVIPRGTCFGARLKDPTSFCLVGCVVAPGFDFADFKLTPRADLLEKYPHHRELILQLTGE